MLQLRNYSHLQSQHLIKRFSCIDHRTVPISCDSLYGTVRYLAASTTVLTQLPDVDIATVVPPAAGPVSTVSLSAPPGRSV